MRNKDAKKPSRLGIDEQVQSVSRQVHSIRPKDQTMSPFTYLVGITLTVVLTLMFMSFVFNLNLIPNSDSYSTQTTDHCQYLTCQGEVLK
jgi:hypothetical protein